MQSINAFIDNWLEDETGNRKAFIELKDLLITTDGVELQFVEREGITYSLRAKHVDQQEKPLFVMVDIVEDEPRWLSVCFYSQMISDKDQRGDFVPGGLLGEDAVCFDLEKYSADLIDYLRMRILEAYEAAAK